MTGKHTQNDFRIELQPPEFIEVPTDVASMQDMEAHNVIESLQMRLFREVGTVHFGPLPAL